MFRENNSHRQTNLFDSINFMHTRVAEKLINTWAHIFYHNVFCKIDEKPFAVLYSDIGRPNFPINILLSLEYIKHLFDYTDEGLVENFYFNFLVSYAVGINVLGELNLAERTLYYFRERVYIYTLQHPDEDDLIFGQFINLTKSFTEIMGISTEEQRMDSSFITSNIKKAGRLALAFDVLEQAVKTLPEELLTESLKQVLKPDFKNTVLYRIKANETTSKLEYIISLCSQMAEIVSNNPDLKSFNEIKILSRFLSEQTEYDVESKVLKPKANDKITADSLQSAYDEDATYRTKGNKSESGYVINIAETCSESNEVQLITDYTVDQNIKSDVELIKERLGLIKESTDCEDMYVDGGYYSEEVIDLAEEEGVNIHYTDMTGREPSPDKLPINEFQFDESTKIIISCPKGEEPIKSVVTKNDTVAHFNKDICSCCEFRDKCPAKEQKKAYVVRISLKAIIASEQRMLIKNNIKENTSKRAAIEGTNSALKRAHGIGKLRVRGLNKCNVVVGLKITAHNFKRFAKYILNKTKEITKPKYNGIPIPNTQ